MIISTWRTCCCSLFCANLVLAGCTPLSTVPVTSQAGTTTTVLLVRHAERNEGLDPPLNAEGEIRAVALADVLQFNGVTAIYCPDLIRNIQTCEAVADRLGLDVNVIGADRLADTRALANELVDEILDLHAGGVVLFVGNTGPVVAEQSGNLQELYARLGGMGEPPIRYQDFYTVVIPEEGDPHFIEATYGGISSLD
ncbi:MAG: phosphoglycerate mutase family protein [Planctomycetota bacterium]